MNRLRRVMSLVAGASLPVQMICFERGLSATTPLFVGEQALCRGVLPGHRRSEPERRARAQGKIKGHGTVARRKPCLHRGKGSTHREWQSAAHGAKPALALGMARASFTRLRRDWPDSTS